MTNVEWTIGELSRLVDRVEKKLDEDAKKLDRVQLEVTQMRAENAASRDRLAERVDALEQWQTWALRIVVSAVAMAIMAFVLADGPPGLIMN